MHQPTTVARPSIYYKYKVFNPWLPSEEQVQTRQKVVVVGAGPAGMVTALELARHGVASIILADELQLYPPIYGNTPASWGCKEND